MKEAHQKRYPRKNTAKIGGAAYAPQQDEPQFKARRPKKPIGARNPAKRKTGKS
jgi:hypothetical protein